MQTIKKTNKIFLIKSSYILIGLFSGFASASMGIGGGAIIIPAFTILLKTDIRKTITISLATIIFSTTTGLLAHYIANHDNIQFTYVTMIASGSVIGAKIGSLLLSKLKSNIIYTLMALLFLLIGIKFLNIFQMQTNINLADNYYYYLIPLGLMIGIASALFGIGGGIITVPALSIFFNFQISQAIATSVAIIVPTSIAGTYFHNKFEQVDYSILKFVIPSAIFGAVLGTIFSNNSDPELLKFIFGIFMIIISIRMLATNFHQYLSSKT